MKKIAAIIAVSGMFALSMPLMAEEPKASTETTIEQEQPVAPEIDLAKENPIEKAFAKDFEAAQATAEINYVSEAYLDAWKAELANVAEVVKKSFTHKEDGKRVDEYLANYESLIKTAFDLEMLNWVSDPDEPIASRSFGTGGTGAAMLSQGKLYKQATLNLIEHYKANPENSYSFIYKGKGAELDKLRNQE